MSEDLSDVLQIGDKTLTMYAGVIMKIDNAIGGFENLDTLPMNTELQLAMVKAIVTKYDEEGNPDGYLLNPFTLNAVDFNKIYEWGLRHYEVFILNSSTKTMEMLKNLQQKMKEFQTNL